MHVAPVAVKMALKYKSEDKVCLITDGNSCAGLEPGVYDFGGKKVRMNYSGGPARIVGSGNLAGSGLTLNLAVKNAVEMLGVDLPLAVRMASANPTDVLKLENTGSIEIDKQTDLILMDEDFKIIRTWVDGISKYEI